MTKHDDEPVESVERISEEQLRNHLAKSDDDLPVVARMVVEIRSDGCRTVARGALEDALKHEKVAIRAEGSSPLALAASLTRALTGAPFVSNVLTSAPFAAGRALRSVRDLLIGDGKE